LTSEQVEERAPADETVAPDAELAAFEASARWFLGSRYGRRSANPDRGGAVVLFEQPDPASDRAGVARARHWLAERFDAGFGWITGPVECCPRARNRFADSVSGPYPQLSLRRRWSVWSLG
jgi:hypothetical protein